MKLTMLIGILLIVLGTAALVFKEFRYTEENEVFEVGPLKTTIEDEKKVRIPEVASVLAIGGGVLLLVYSRR